VTKDPRRGRPPQVWQPAQVPERSRGRIVGLVALIVVGFLLSGSVGALAYFLPVIRAAASQTGHSGELSATATPSANNNNAANPAPASTGEPFTVLLLGSDDDAKFEKDQLLTQSMILVRIIPQTNQVTMLSIPRDLWVPLSTGGMGKIDAAYLHGGAKAAIATVERNFRVHVDEFVWIGLKGLIKLIDRVGGVDVITSNPVLDDWYPDDINTPNPYAIARIAVLPGPQHLDGTHALQYVRSRHSDLRGDFGRSQRQQQVLIALRAKATHVSPADLPDVAAAFQGELQTSMALPRVRQLLPIATHVSVESVKQVVLLPPYTSSGKIGDQDVVLANWSEILPVVRQTFPPG
jgi:LCP family protein required for cell wall assembly